MMNITERSDFLDWHIIGENKTKVKYLLLNIHKDIKNRKQFGKGLKR
jgi:hypothetical protein